MKENLLSLLFQRNYLKSSTCNLEKTKCYSYSKFLIALTFTIRLPIHNLPSTVTYLSIGFNFETAVRSFIGIHHVRFTRVIAVGIWDPHAPDITSCQMESTVQLSSEARIIPVLPKICINFVLLPKKRDIFQLAFSRELGSWVLSAIKVQLQNSCQFTPAHTIFASSMFPKDSTYKLHSTMVGLSNSRGNIIVV